MNQLDLFATAKREFEEALARKFMLRDWISAKHTTEIAFQCVQCLLEPVVGIVVFLVGVKLISKLLAQWVQ